MNIIHELTIFSFLNICTHGAININTVYITIDHPEDKSMKSL